MSETDTARMLDLDLLMKLVDEAVAIRGRATLEPAGGAGDKIFPPTHHVDDKAPKPGAKYAFEVRRIAGEEIECVLLDSVQSQANRMEDALQSLWSNKQITLPVVVVDFSEVAPDVGIVTSLTAPHRIADALLRDSFVGNELFRMSEIGRSFTDASTRNATPLFKLCPTALVFGLWDSTGPKRGLGAKFARALSSEIVGIGATRGVKTESRIDPASIVNGAGILYIRKRAKGEPLTWTLDEKEAEKDGKEPLRWGSKYKNGKWTQGEGTPASAVHGNIPPKIVTVAGGVTIDRAEQTVVLSLAALRKLSFQDGDREGRAVLAALGVLAVLAAESRGHDLRSRCLLVPTPQGELALEAVARNGTSTRLRVDLQGAIRLYEAAVAALPKALRFETKPGDAVETLKPSPKLASLVKTSRELAATGAEIEDA